jgi:hypothetical protein
MAPTSALNTKAIDRVRVLGSKLNVELRDALTSATIDMSMDQVTQLTMTFADPGWKALRAGAGIVGSRVDFDDFRLQIAVTETAEVDGTEGFKLSCRPVSVSNLKNRRGAKVMSNVSPSQFVMSECNAIGVKHLVQPSARRPQVARDVPQKGQTYSEPPSTWTTFKRLADELGFVVWEAADTVYFGKPSWFLAHPSIPTIQANYKYGDQKYWVDELPVCRRSLDSKQVTIDLVVPSAASYLWMPGRKVNFIGVPLFGGKYLLDSSSFDLLGAGENVEVTALTPIDPVANPPQTAAKTSSSSSSNTSRSSGTSSTTRRSTKNAGDFVYWAQRQLGDRYVWGAAVSKSTNPTAFDCSSLVKWAASMVGVYMPRTSSEQIAYCARKGTTISVSRAKGIRGALLWHPGHIAISLGNGRTIEAANSRAGVVNYGTGSRFSRAALVPGMRY